MRVLLGSLCSVLCLSLAAFASEDSYIGPALNADYSGPALVDNTQFLYTAQDRLTFITADYLAASYPHLLPLRPTIDTWASRLGIHPRLLSVVVDNLFTGSRVTGDRKDIGAVVQLATALAEVFTGERSNPLAASRAVKAASDALFFEIHLPAGLDKIRQQGMAGGTTPPPLYGYFQPPWPIGDTWAGGGAHGSSHNALDFWGRWRPWGDPDVFSYWVTAMQSGTLRVWSSCSVSVIHDNGWVTGYYHLENVQLPDFAAVERDDVLANYADDEAQATCSGGWSSGPHVHMSINYNGSSISVDEDNVDFTAFSHHAGPGDYNTNCNESWYDHDSVGQVCPNYDQLLNDTTMSAGLFADGFESGNRAAWSSTAP
jgi:LasA protease